MLMSESGMPASLQLSKKFVLIVSISFLSSPRFWYSRSVMFTKISSGMISISALPLTVMVLGNGLGFNTVVWAVIIELSVTSMIAIKIFFIIDCFFVSDELKDEITYKMQIYFFPHLWRGIEGEVYFLNLAMASFIDRLKNLNIIRKIVYFIVGMFSYPGLTMVNKLKISGTEHIENLPRKKVLFVSNHQTYFADVITFLHIFCAIKWGNKNRLGLPYYLLNPFTNLGGCMLAICHIK